MQNKITDKQRIEWLLDHNNISITRHNGMFSITAWICNGEPGNENMGGSRFYTTGRTRLDCVDNFLIGSIKLH